VIRRVVPALLAVALLLGCTAAVARQTVAPPSAGALLADVERLAAPDTEGRGSATPGNERAARWLADALAAAGLRPGGDNGTFFQSFPIASGTRLAADNALALTTPTSQSFDVEREWTPHGGSVQAEIAAEVVFAGYGLVVPESGYDDYAGIDARDKIVLVVEGAPPHLASAPASRLDKLITARRRGAAAVLITAASLPGPVATATPVGVVSAHVSPAVANRLLGPHGDVVTLTARMGATRRPASMATTSRARVRVALEREERRTANVIGVLPGTDPALSAEAIVIGAHFDHLGRVGDVTHAGADDNASGTAVALGLARAFAAAGGAPRTLILALFSGEEIGLLGSAHYVRQPAWPLARTAAMLNFDMVGRMRDDKLHVGGVDSAAALRSALLESGRAVAVDLVLRGTPYSPSDHSSFYGAGVPVLFFFTGLHDDYHRATDTADRINADGMAKVARVAIGVVERLAAGLRPAYVKLDRPARGQASGTPGRAFFGVVSSRDAGADGVRLGGVQPGSAAARAGVRPGDVLVRFAGTPVNSFEQLRQAVAARQPGDRVDVVYLRDGEDHATSATLDAHP